MSLTLPEPFLARTEPLLGDATAAFLQAMNDTPPVSVRWNPYKTAGAPDGAPVPWNRYGRYLTERPSFTTDPLFHAGAYYVQEASSMFVEHLVRSAAEPEGARILDLCAAPGGKATLYATLAGAEGIVVANEVVRNRALTLADNARKWGIGNMVVTNDDTARLAGLTEWFDIVAVDAPCSGEGMFRKNPDAMAEWSPSAPQLCAARQRQILADAWEALRPGGLLIYSTCTFNREENEENVAWLAEHYDCSDAGVEVPAAWGIEQTEAGGIRCFRFWPHRLRGEGFFAAALRKEGQKGRPFRPKARKPLFAEPSRRETEALARWIAQPEFMRFARIGDTYYGYYAAPYGDIRTLAEYLHTLHSGVCMGQLFNGTLKPDPSLALFHDLNRTAAPEAALSREDALHYLRREELPSPEAFNEGMNLVTCEGYALGWAKRIGQRINNLYPKSLAILYK